VTLFEPKSLATLNRSTGEVSCRAPWTAPVFLLFFCYVWLVVDPRLVDHSLGLLTEYSGFAFSDGWPFFQERLARPGGAVEYLAGFLAQLFRFGWVGALIVTVGAWALGRLADWRIALGAVPALGAGLPTPPGSDRRSPAPMETPGSPGDAVGRPHPSATPHPSVALCRSAGQLAALVRFVPAAVLLVMIGRYHCPIGTVLSLLVGLACFAVYVYAAPSGTLHRVLTLLVAVTAAYHVAEAGGLVFPALAAAYELLVRRRPTVAAAALLCAAAVPWLVGTMRFGLSPSDAYGHFLWTDPGLVRARTPYGLVLFALFPLVLAGTAPGHAGSVRYGVRNGIRGVVQTGMVLVGLGVAGWLSLDTAVRTLLEMDRFARQGEWDQVLAAAERMPPGRTSAGANRNILLALYHTGRLGDAMFRYPQVHGRGPFAAAKDDGDYGALFQLSRIYFDLGQVNYAEKYGYDALDVAGEVPAALEHLALLSVVQGRRGAAHILLGALGKNPFFRGRASERIRQIESDPPLAADPRIAAVRSMVPESDSFTRQIDVEEVLLALLKKNPKNRMAFEFLMAHWLAHGQPEKVAENLGRLKDLGYTRTPRHYQEALLIARGPDAAGRRSAGYEIEPDVLRQFESFLAIVKREPDAKAAAREARAAGLGETYFFFLSFGVSGF